MPKVTIPFTRDGYPCTLVVSHTSPRRLLRKVAKLIDWLKAHGFEPAPAEDAEAPLCPEHNVPMRPSKFGPGWYCAEKVEGGYCGRKANGSEGARGRPSC